MSATNESRSVSSTLVSADTCRSQMVTAIDDHQGECHKGSVVGYYCERIEGQEERADGPKKVKKRDTDNKLDGD